MRCTELLEYLKIFMDSFCVVSGMLGKVGIHWRMCTFLLDRTLVA